MLQRNGLRHLVIPVLISALLAACAAPPASGASSPTRVAGTAAPTEPPTPSIAEGTTAGSSAGDLLNAVQARRTLIVATDPKYPPRSEVVEGVSRDPGTKCAPGQLTAGQLKGFDVDVASAVARGLKVEPCFVTPDWEAITSGGWGGRWDIAVDSISITPDRLKTLTFSQPYSTLPAAFFVARGSRLTRPSDLSGKTIGACTGCAYDAYLSGALTIPGEKIEVAVKNITLRRYETDATALEDLAAGRLDGVLTAQSAGAEWIARGVAVRQLGDPVFVEFLAAAFDRGGADSGPLASRVSEVVRALHKDGTLKKLSVAAYGADLTAPAATFDLSALGR